MTRRSVVCAALAMLILGAGMTTGAAAIDETGVAVGASVRNPEARTGIWEARVASDRTIGLDIAMNTRTDPAVRSLSDASHIVRYIRIVPYVRAGAEERRGLWMSEPASNATFDWRRDRLRLRVPATDSAPVPVDLDLRFDPLQSSWTGTFAGLGFSGPIVLVRPDRPAPESPVGSWRSGAACVHVAMGEDGRLIAWTDSTFLGDPISIPGEPHARVPNAREVAYGWISDDLHERSAQGRWTFRIGNSLYGDTYTGSLSADRTRFSGTVVHDGNGFAVAGNAPRPFTWQRASGPCLEATE